MKSFFILFFLILLNLSIPAQDSPDLFWSTFYGGNSNEHGISTAVDSFNNVYVTGITLSSNFPVSVNAFQPLNSGDFDAFVIKFSPSGQRLWATYFGGSAYDEGRNICIDKNGDIVIIGITNSTNLPVTNGSFQYNNAGNYDMFAAKFNNTGQRIWATYCGGANNDYGYGIKTDINNNVFITGFSNSGNFPVTPDAFQLTNGGGDDCFIIKFNSAGQRVWATYYGGSLNDDADAVTIDNAGNILLTGATYSPNFPVTAGSFQAFNAGNSDAFIIKFNNNGLRIWASYYGGTSDDFGFGGIVTDNNNSIIFSGRTSSPNFPITSNAFQLSNGGNNDAYVVKFDSAGQRQYSTYYGGNANDFGESVVIDSSGNIIISGFTNSQNFSVTTDAYQSINAGQTDAFIIRFNNIWQRQYATYLGGTGIDECYSVSSTKNGNFIITGKTGSTNFPIIAGAFQTNKAGGDDAFISFFNRDPIGITPISTNVPDKFSLGQNYPNPFNPTTNIEFQIPKSGLVNLTIYDALGRKVETLVNQNLCAGTYKADLDASNLVSGIYFYRLSAGDFSETKKMILLK
jgi:hypothetical protein